MVIKIEGWRPGCIFSSDFQGDDLNGLVVESEKDGVLTFENGSTALKVRKPEGVFACEAQTVEQCPDDGTSSSRVSGIWYGNAEIKGYLREGSWRPWAGKFRLVFSVGGLPPGWRPETQELVGWWRKPFVNFSIWTIEDYGF